MSFWTKILGVIKVQPMGRTQFEKEYILKTVIDHLPPVTGSEHDMNIHINKNDNYKTRHYCNEFGEKYSYKKKYNYKNYMLIQDEYIITVDGYFRDRVDSDTIREFSKWLCRLAKRVEVLEVCVSITGGKTTLISSYDCGSPYYEMFEEPSWVSDTGSSNWCEYLMWNEDAVTGYPEELGRKYCKHGKNKC